jgi:hypothetical protein
VNCAFCICNSNSHDREITSKRKSHLGIYLKSLDLVGLRHNILQYSLEIWFEVFYGLVHYKYLNVINFVNYSFNLT